MEYERLVERVEGDLVNGEWVRNALRTSPVERRKDHELYGMGVNGRSVLDLGIFRTAMQASKQSSSHVSPPRYLQ